MKKTQQKQNILFFKGILVNLTLSLCTVAISAKAYGAEDRLVIDPCVMRTWATGNTYVKGQIVSSRGHNYKLKSEDLDNAKKWNPSAAPVLWKDLGKCKPPSEYVGDNTTLGFRSSPDSLKPLPKGYVSSTAPISQDDIGLKPKTSQVDIESFPFLLTEEQFFKLFPRRHEIYTYEGLQLAYLAFKDFAGVGDLEVRRREFAAFLANVAHETGGLVYVEQFQKGDYCQPDQKYLCQRGRQYYGRGALQISWNNMYGRMGEQLKIPFLDHPEIISSPNGGGSVMAWLTAVWYWMYEKGGSAMTAHEAMVQNRGFGGTIAAINGKAECGLNPEQAQDRINRYRAITLMMGISPGPNLECFAKSEELAKKARQIAE